MSINDARFACLISRGFDSEATNDMELKWLVSSGATSSDLNGAWKEFLELQGFLYTTYPDAKRAWLLALGYSGSTQDMLNQYWSDCPSQDPEESTYTQEYKTEYV